ncbi:MAG: DNA mismatch repair protein MutS, partial [Parasporobacterium sp.]|nr:DNA mismatch repair protein MutS [Parasporobacterium sp.]
IPNDTYSDNEEDRVSIITGPNMAGKSTYMRQLALIVLMAGTGSFVPAAEADICICDRIFTRVGASDDLASGQSTFMVEMTEVANILRNATARSLIILDEIGRGTSTYDGLSIAWAVVEYIADKKKCGAKTFFSTHYHELTELEGTIDGVKNYCISVKEQADTIIFLRKIVRGGADKSYGIQVAALAGVPAAITKRAEEIVAELISSDISQTKEAEARAIVDNASSIHPESSDLSSETENGHFSEAEEYLKTLEVEKLTPLEALNILDQLMRMV